MYNNGKVSRKISSSITNNKPDNTNKKLAIVGAGGQGKVIADIAERNGYNEIFF